jgi:hypothetical protein
MILEDVGEKFVTTWARYERSAATFAKEERTVEIEDY